MVVATQGGTSNCRQATWWETTGANVAFLGGSFIFSIGGLATGVYIELPEPSRH